VRRSGKVLYDQYPTIPDVGRHIEALPICGMPTMVSY